MKTLTALFIIIFIILVGCQENITDPVQSETTTLTKTAPQFPDYTFAVGVIPFQVMDEFNFTFYVHQEAPIYIAIYNDIHTNIRQMIVNNVVMSVGYHTIHIVPSQYLDRHEEYWVTVWADFALNLEKSCVKMYYLDIPEQVVTQ